MREPESPLRREAEPEVGLQPEAVPLPTKGILRKQGAEWKRLITPARQYPCLGFAADVTRQLNDLRRAKDRAYSKLLGARLKLEAGDPLEVTCSITRVDGTFDFFGMLDGVMFHCLASGAGCVVDSMVVIADFEPDPDSDPDPETHFRPESTQLELRFTERLQSMGRQMRRSAGSRCNLFVNDNLFVERKLIPDPYAGARVRNDAAGTIGALQTIRYVATLAFAIDDLLICVTIVLTFVCSAIGRSILRCTTRLTSSLLRNPSDQLPITDRRYSEPKRRISSR